MKTNHFRDFKESRSSSGEKAKYVRKALVGTHIGKAYSPDGDVKIVYAKSFDPDAGNAKKAQRNNVKGAKKFIRSRVRAYENRQLQSQISSLIY